jgi:hypothetical protein
MCGALKVGTTNNLRNACDYYAFVTSVTIGSVFAALSCCGRTVSYSTTILSRGTVITIHAAVCTNRSTTICTASARFRATLIIHCTRSYLSAESLTNDIKECIGSTGNLQSQRPYPDGHVSCLRKRPCAFEEVPLIINVSWRLERAWE